MADANFKGQSLFVGWFHIIVCVAVPTVYTLINLYIYEVMASEYQDKYYGSSTHFLTSTAVGFISWLILSILLVIGIKHNRRLFMAPWLYVSYALTIFGPLSMVPTLIFVGAWGGWEAGLFYGLPLAAGVVIMVLCLIPVTKLYKHLGIPPPVLPIQCNIQTKQPEDHQRYMPLFDN